MKTIHFFVAIAVSVIATQACTSGSNRMADDSVEQAQDVNDTTATVKEDDADFAVKAADGALAEIQLGKLALEKATDPRIREFSQKMVADHERANNELMTIAAKHQITLPPVVSRDHIEDQQELSEKAGDEFHREYVELMVQSHNQAVNLFSDAATDAQNTDLQAFAAKILPTLKKHREEARMLRDSISPVDTTTVQRIMP